MPTEEIWRLGLMGGQGGGLGASPNAPDYLSVSPLGTRTGSEHGERPGRPNWRPSQTVKRGECRGSAAGADGGEPARHGTHSTAPMARHPQPLSMAPSPAPTLHGEHGQGAGARGFLVLLPAARPRFPPRNWEPGATGCSPLRFPPLGPLRRETEAHKNLSGFQATSQGQSLILQAPCSRDALHRAPTPWEVSRTPHPQPGRGCSVRCWAQQG